MKIALIGNINNNFYHIVKFLRREGIEADLYLPDYDYWMASPEWEEGRFDSAMVPSRYPKWAWVEMQNVWERPGWVKSIPLLTWYHLPFAEMDPFVKQMEWRLNARLKWRQHRIVNEALRRRGLPELSFEETTRFFDIYMWERIVQNYDIIQTQGWYTLHCLADYPPKPHIIHDYGQPLRQFVLEESTRGHLFRAAYQYADTVVLMNPDTRDVAERLGLRYVFIPYPLDETKFCPGPSAVRTELEARYGKDVIILFAPARHYWSVKGNDKLLRAFTQFVKEHRFKSVILILIAWGEVDKARVFICEAGIEEYVLWLQPLNRNTTLDYYRAADIILDQFVLGTPGRTAFEGMACAKPVVCYFRPELHEWCYPEMPPLYSAQTDKEIHFWLEVLIDALSLRQERGQLGRQWIERYYGWRNIARAYIDLYTQILARPGQYLGGKS